MPDPSPILQGLNPAQREAVNTVQGPLLVIAGAGSGKTRVITRRIARLVEVGAEPETILAVTFTNKAAREMRERVEALLGRGGPLVATFHAFGARFLRGEAGSLDRPASFTLFDRGDSEAAVKTALDELKLDRNVYAPRLVMEAISRFKSRLVDVSGAHEEACSGFEEDVARTYGRYEEVVARSGAFDFDDLIEKSVRLLRERPEVLARLNDRFRHVLVDEYQDVNHAQYVLTRLLGDAHGNVAVTGDPDQCIYTWRGAEIDYILDFPRHYPAARVVRLEQNYRSVNNVLKAASAVIRFNDRHGEKSLWSEKPAGPPIVIRRVADERDEARAVVDRIHTLLAQGARRREIAVFYRLNSLSLPLERALIAANVPYQVIHGLEFFKRKEVKDALAYLRYLANPMDEVSLRRIVNTPARGIGDKTLKELERQARRAGTSLGAFIEKDGPQAAPGARAGKAVQGFVDLVAELRDRIGGPVAPLLRLVLELSGYEQHLSEKADGLDPLGNLEQLVAFARDHDVRGETQGLAGFLEEVSLFGEADAYEQELDRVVLMTVHAAKGLEFRHVIVIGMDAEIFPHRGRLGPADEPEERRLFYVALTRAMESVTLLTAQARTRFGAFTLSRPSIFLTEIPEELTTTVDDAGGDAQVTADMDRGIEYEMDDDFRISRGARVRHKTFGAGTVQAVAGRGADARVTIDFDSGDRRKVILRYAGLESLD